MLNSTTRETHLPEDNAARITIFDALAELLTGRSTENGVAVEELHDHVIRRLRMIVPRELYLKGEHAYFYEKLGACLQAGMLQQTSESPPRYTLGVARPQIMYPDRSIRDYDRGLEGALERLQADDAKLKGARFDVLELVPTYAEEPDGPQFRGLLASMRDLGFFEGSAIACGADGTVVDGRARVRAAQLAGLAPDSVRRVALPPPRDTPLFRALFALDINSHRLPEDARAAVQDGIAERSRPWDEIERDLILTRVWRLTPLRRYTAQLDVKRLRYRNDLSPKVQVTRDGTRVMLRSLLEAAGLASYKYDYLAPYVPTEKARTRFTPGRDAIFVTIADAIGGIGKMQKERRSKGLKIDAEWSEIRKWLSTISGSESPNGEDEPGESAGSPS